MDAIALLTEARSAGLQVTTDGEKLIVRGLKSAEPLARQLLARKAEVLPLVQQPMVDTSCTPPDRLAVIHGADGTPWHVVLYRCPQCGGTRWGPRLDAPDCWVCLDCHPEAPTVAAALLSTPEEVRHE